MPDPHEALGQDVEQEATDELLGIEVHDLLLVGVRGVAVAERDAIGLDAQDTMVRDGDAMCVGAEVGENTFGSCEGRLRVDDPVAAAKRVAELRNGGVVAEFSAFEGAQEAFEELPSEDLGQGAYRKEKTLGGRREKVLLVRGQRTARDDAVQMWMQREVLCPGVQNRRDAECAALRLSGEVTPILSKGGECRCRSAEQEIVNDPWSVQRQGTELVRQGEDDVEVLDREQIGTSGFDPIGLSQRLTLGAVPVAARVIDGAPVPALVAGFEVATEGCRSTLTQVADGVALNGTHLMGVRITLSMTAKEITEFRRRSGSLRMRFRRRLRECAHDGLLGRVD